jgi:hypothetical protein
LIRSAGLLSSSLRFVGRKFSAAHPAYLCQWILQVVVSAVCNAVGYFEIFQTIVVLVAVFVVNVLC